MFIGHFAVGFAAKRVQPGLSLGWLMAATLLPDLLWAFFLLTGLERVRIAPGDTAVTPLEFQHYPYSHSLLASLAWAGLLAVLGARRHGRRAAVVLAAGVLSHFCLDWVSHRPDLPLYPGSEIRVGLGLWRSVPGTLVVESTLFGLSLWLYGQATRPRDRAGRWGLAVLVAFLVTLYAGSVLGPPPPSVNAVALADLALWPVVPWVAWIDRHRVARPG